MNLMPKKRLLLATLGLLAVLGCQSTPVNRLPPPRSTMALVLNQDDRAILQELPLGSALKITLPPPLGGAGFNWEIVSNYNRVLWQTAELKPDSDAKGAGAWAVAFQAIRPGRSTLRFASIKSGQAFSEPDDVFQISVTVKAE